MRNPVSKINPQLAREAKSIVVLAFRNGPIEDLHAGKPCPTCAGNPEYSHLTQEEMKRIMKKAVDKIYALLWMQAHNPEGYTAMLTLGEGYTRAWDDPEFNESPPIL
jgi:hypothetical protein